jgi:cyclophilin family peptidyl-prolyl cis-trans isomerase
LPPAFAKSKKVAEYKKTVITYLKSGSKANMAKKILYSFVIVSVLAAISLQSGCDKQTAKSTKPVQKDEKIMTTQDKAVTKVRIETSKGDIIVELNEQKAPVTCKNFLSYVEDKFYDGTIFHRVIKGFMVQGGGMTADLRQKSVKPSIVNEAKNGLKNDRGTIAMARTPDPDSATSQFFINHGDNEFLNYGVRDEGYAVFGKVVEGMDVVDAIAAVQTRPGDVPAETVLIKSIRVE